MTKFEGTSDRRAWRVYAAAALSKIIPAVEPGSIVSDVDIAARYADWMLAEEKKRR